MNPQTVNMWQLQVRGAYTQQSHNCKYRGLSVCVQDWDCSGLCVSLPRDTTKDWLLAGLAKLPEQLPPLDLPAWCFSWLLEAAFSKDHMSDKHRKAVFNSGTVFIIVYFKQSPITSPKTLCLFVRACVGDISKAVCPVSSPQAKEISFIFKLGQHDSLPSNLPY